jgi:hypothetical protein
MKTTKELPKIGNVNACGLAFVKDKQGNTIAQTLDTPNAIAYAFKVLPTAVNAISFYPMVKPIVTDREKLADRFHFVNEVEHGKYLTIL